MKIFKYQTLSQIGELALLERLCCRLPLRDDVIAGAGDDCAVVRPSGSENYDYLLKSDGVVEGVHFQSDTKPELIGHKALGRVLSDMAAMGGEPLWILVDLAAPARTPVKRIEKVYAGMTKLARQFKISIVGGDVSSAKELQLHVFGAGRIKKGKAILRSGAKPGEVIFVTGSLGGSIFGKHLAFMPRLAEGKWLANGRWASAMIDVSDGLLRDLGYLASAGKVGARLWLDSIPISAAGRRSAAGKNALKHALNDGEDYELLFTVPAKKVHAFVKTWRRAFKLSCTRIGQITARTGCLEGIDSAGKVIKLNEAGFDHFRKRKGQSVKGT